MLMSPLPSVHPDLDEWIHTGQFSGDPYPGSPENTTPGGATGTPGFTPNAQMGPPAGASQPIQQQQAQSGQMGPEQGLAPVAGMGGTMDYRKSSDEAIQRQLAMIQQSGQIPAPQMKPFGTGQLLGAGLLALIGGRSAGELTGGYAQGLGQERQNQFQNAELAAQTQRQALQTGAQAQGALGTLYNQRYQQDRTAEETAMHHRQLESESTERGLNTQRGQVNNAIGRMMNAYRGASTLGAMQAASKLMAAKLEEAKRIDPNFEPVEGVFDPEQVLADYQTKHAPVVIQAQRAWENSIKNQLNEFQEVTPSALADVTERRDAFARDAGVSPQDLRVPPVGGTYKKQHDAQIKEQWEKNFDFKTDKWAVDVARQDTRLDYEKERLSIMQQNANTMAANGDVFAANAITNRYRTALDAYKLQATQTASSIDGQLKALDMKRAGAEGVIKGFLGQTNLSKEAAKKLVDAQAQVNQIKGQKELLEGKRDGYFAFLGQGFVPPETQTTQPVPNISQVTIPNVPNGATQGGPVPNYPPTGTLPAGNINSGAAGSAKSSAPKAAAQSKPNQEAVRAEGIALIAKHPEQAAAIRAKFKRGFGTDIDGGPSYSYRVSHK